MKRVVICSVLLAGCGPTVIEGPTGGETTEETASDRPSDEDPPPGGDLPPPEEPEEPEAPEEPEEPMESAEEALPPPDPTEQDAPAVTASCPVVAPTPVPATCPFPSELVIYGQQGWNVLGDALAPALSDCTNAYVSVPPQNGDKTKLRANQAQLMRARGPHMHAMAEFHFTTWNNKRIAEGLSWTEIGGQFREEMEAKGYCVSAGDTWAINEAPSTLRKEETFRAAFAELLEGLATGRPGMPVAKGAVFIVGFGHKTQNLSLYKTNIRATLQHDALWTRANNAVRFWGQETYVDPQHTCVAGATVADRRQRVMQYAMHPHRLSVVAPDSASVNTAQSFLGRTYVPVMNAVWDASPERGYGDTRLSLTQMQRFIRMQVDAVRNYATANAAPDGRIGFAFASYHDPQEWQAIGETLADAVGAAYAQGSVPADACGSAGCGCVADGATENLQWSSFSTW